MNTRQLLSSAVAATAIVGTIGFASAQSTTTDATAPSANPPSSQSTDTTQAPGRDTSTPAATSNMPSSSSTTPSSSATSPSDNPSSATDASRSSGSEPAPKADRN